MTTTLRGTVRSAERSLDEMLTARGFEKRTRASYLIRLPGGLFGTVGLTRKLAGGTPGETFDIYPLVGVGHTRIAEITHEIVAGAPRDRASVSVGLGYLTPTSSWTGYRIDAGRSAQSDGVLQLVRDIDAYATPFLTRHQSIQDIIDSMCEYWGGDLVAQDLPIAYCLIDQGHRAREYIAGYVGQKRPEFLRLYLPFLKGLRERLLPPPAQTDSGLEVDVIAALRKVLPLDWTFNEVLAFWRAFVAEVERQCDRSFNEYQNALGLRELLETTVTRIPDLSRRAGRELIELDVAFRSATYDAPDDEPLGSAWWWKRLPSRPGPRLARSLSSRGLLEPGSVPREARATN